MREIMDAYAKVDEEKLWEHLDYFIKRIIPEAEAVGVKITIHPMIHLILSLVYQGLSQDLMRWSVL